MVTKGMVTKGMVIKGHGNQGHGNQEHGNQGPRQYGPPCPAAELFLTSRVLPDIAAVTKKNTQTKKQPCTWLRLLEGLTS